MQKITVVQASRLLNMNPQLLREHLKRGKVQIGWAIQRPNSDQWTYTILPGPLASALGIDIQELERRVEVS